MSRKFFFFHFYFLLFKIYSVLKIKVEKTNYFSNARQKQINKNPIKSSNAKTKIKEEKFRNGIKV